MTLNCIIIDDEPMARKVLEEYIGDIDFLHLAGRAENPLKAHSLLGTQPIDLMFLDINMPRMNGIEFLRSSTSLPPAILTTAYTEYAIQGFELDVLDYLVKPFAFERFYKAACKAREYLELLQRKNTTLVAGVGPTAAGAGAAGAPDQTGVGENSDPAGSAFVSPDYFFVKCEGRIEKVFHSELLYIEAMLNYVVLHTETRKLIVYLTIKGIGEQLPSKKFVKIHKSTIINVEKVRNIEGNKISLGKADVVISQALQESVIKEILSDRMLKR